MPPRFAYWTIILEGKPTAFRAQHREDLLPTFKQLQAKHPDVAMMWFGRGRLWASPEDARAADRRGTERRKPDWRPGGEHRDPRARFEIPRDEKRRRFAAKLRRDRRDQPPHGPDSGSDRYPPRRDNRGRDDRDRAAPPRSEWKPAGPGPARPAWKNRKPGPRGPRFGEANRDEPGREQRAPGSKPQRFPPKGPGHRPAGPHGFKPKGRDDRGGGDRPKRFTPKAWRNDRGRGSNTGRRGGGRGGGGQSR